MRKSWLISLGILLQVTLPVFSVHAAVNFQDVPSDYVYAPAIQSLKDRGIVNGYDGLHFGPERLITRAELLKIALEGAGVDTSAAKNAESPFSDLDAKHSLRQYVIYAQNHHIVSGYADGTYRPDQPTTRAEAIKILLNINAVTVVGTVTSSPYQDLTTADPLAPFVVTAREKRIIPGKYAAKKVGTGEQIRRGEVAEMMFRLLFLKENAAVTYPEKADAITVVPGTHSTTLFAGLTIQTPIAKTMVANTYYPITVTTSASTVKVVIEDSDHEQSVWGYKVSQGRATFDVMFPAAGKYNLAMAIDDRTTLPVMPIVVVPSWQFGAQTDASPITGAQFSSDGEGHVSLMWSGTQGRTLVHLLCTQGTETAERFVVSGGQKWELDYRMFAAFKPDLVHCSVAQATAVSTLATSQVLSAPYAWDFSALTHYFRTWDKQNVMLDDGLPLFTDALTLTLNGHATIPLSNYAEMILPSGNVQIFSFQDAKETVLNSGIAWQLNLQLTEPGVYFLELNDTNGIAVLNTPIYRTPGVPVLPDFLDMQEGVVVTNKTPLTPTEQEQMIADLLARVNSLRTSLGRGAVTLDTNLSTFAQAHADDMVSQNYFSHRDKAGRDPDLRKVSFGISYPVGENIAFSMDVNSADEGLKRSPAHRLNTLDPRWTTIGIGVARKSDGLLYVVEEFSTNKAAIAEKTLNRINANRTSAGLSPLTLGTEFDTAIRSWETNPRTTSLQDLLLAAGLTRGKSLTYKGSYSPNLPAEMALATAVSNASFSKMAMGIIVDGEVMTVAVVLY